MNCFFLFFPFFAIFLQLFAKKHGIKKEQLQGIYNTHIQPGIHRQTVGSTRDDTDSK
jgi:hypothetical protein